MRKTVQAICVLGSILFAAGCATIPDDSVSEACTTVIALYTDVPVRMDGRLDDPVWRDAPAYPLHLAADVDPGGLDDVQEPGEARFAWDDDNLYIAIHYTDSDVVAEGEHDNDMHFTMGDVGEVFIKPDGNTLYWELYVTPHGMKSAFFFPSWSRSLPSSFDYTMDLHVAAKVDGSLNDWTDRDKGWTGEMAIPRAELEQYGDAFPGEGWSILVARYNYGRYLEKQGAELTMMPRLPMTSYHYHPGYARLELRREVR